MKFNKQVINYILSEVDQLEVYKDIISTHASAEGRLLGKLLFYRKSVWEAPEKKSNLYIEGDVSEALTNKQASFKTADQKDDKIIPFILVIQGSEGYKEGEIYQVSKERVTGEAFNPEFLAMADMIKKNRKTKDGKIMLEGVKTPKEKMEALERNWGKLRMEFPWLEWDEDTVAEDYLFYEIPFPELKSKISLDILKSLVNEK